MGLFDKKNCDICGEKIGLLGNRKLEDGNLCKDCAKKLSPFFSERKQSTVEEIRKQLAYREENERRLASFRPSRTYGDSMKVYIDDANGIFIATRASDWKSGNPDIIAISQVTSCNLDIQEMRREIFYQDNDGNDRSYNPPRFEYEYEFNIIINVNSPWFSQIRFELNPMNHPDSRYTDIYRNYERVGNELCAALSARVTGAGYGSQPQYSNAQSQYNAQQQYNNAQQQYMAGAAAYATVPSQTAAWVCQSCGTQNNGKFCQGCGAQKPCGGYRCDKCGWTPASGQSVPRFCPQCGDPFDVNDAV